MKDYSEATEPTRAQLRLQFERWFTEGEFEITHVFTVAYGALGMLDWLMATNRLNSKRALLITAITAEMIDEVLSSRIKEDADYNPLAYLLDQFMALGMWFQQS